MMKWVFSGLILLSIVFGIGQGRMDQVTFAALNSCGNAIALVITLAGSICMWNGLMRIAQKAELTEKISRLFSPVIKLIFEKMDYKSAAAQAITLNISANLLGLGNAATPLGLLAMEELQKTNPTPNTASNNMIMFVVLNTASLQLIPTTTALLRSTAGSATPLDFMPATWVASLVSVLSGIFVVLIFNRFGKTRGTKHEHR